MKFECNSIVVVESIPTGQRLTGKELFDDIIKIKCDQKNLGSTYVDILSSVEFFGLLKDICYKAKHEALLPVIHFEMHGNKSGLALKNGEIINWYSFVDLLRKINITCRNNLFISVSACCGGFIQDELDIMNKSPFYVFIWPARDITPKELYENYVVFYDAFILEGNVSLASRRLNEVCKDFNYANCEVIFDDLVKSFRNEEATRELANVLWQTSEYNDKYHSIEDLTKDLMSLAHEKEKLRSYRKNFCHHREIPNNEFYK